MSVSLKVEDVTCVAEIAHVFTSSPVCCSTTATNTKGSHQVGVIAAYMVQSLW
jgi:hypothetical protein